MFTRLHGMYVCMIFISAGVPRQNVHPLFCGPRVTAFLERMKANIALLSDKAFLKPDLETTTI